LKLNGAGVPHRSAPTHLGQGQHDAGHILRHAVGRLDRGALGQVDHHRQLRLVVEGQQLHRHVLGIQTRQDSRRTAPPSPEEQQRPAAAGQHRPRHRAVERPSVPAGVAAMAVVMGMRAHVARPAILTISQGVMMTATKKEKIIAAQALTGSATYRGPSAR
jgi:hypothetical protein